MFDLLINLGVSTYALCRGSYISGTLGARYELGRCLGVSIHWRPFNRLPLPAVPSHAIRSGIVVREYCHIHPRAQAADPSRFFHSPRRSWYFGHPQAAHETRRVNSDKFH
jgi:hypothetical protein